MEDCCVVDVGLNLLPRHQFRERVVITSGSIHLGKTRQAWHRVMMSLESPTRRHCLGKR